MMMLRCIRCKKRFAPPNGESPFLCPEHRAVVRREIRRAMKKTMRFHSMHRKKALERADKRRDVNVVR